MREKEKIKKRVMILDDEPYAVEALRDRLQYHGLDVEVVDRPEECLEGARRRPYDLFILDFHLGPTAPAALRDGLKVARALRKESSTVNVPIAGITGVLPEKREEALALGMVKVFLKPMNLDHDVPALLALLESRTQAQQAIATWLVETAGENWNVLELTVSDGYAHLRSTLATGEGPLSLQGRDLSLALRLIHQGQFDKELFEEIGMRLYEGLFPLQVNVGLQQCLLLSQLAQQPLRLLLRIEDSLWEHLPWELCRYTGGTHGGHWLGGDPYLTCTRRAPNTGALQADEALTPTLRILVLGASPISSPPLELREELIQIRDALEPLNRSTGQGKRAIEWKILGPPELADVVPGTGPLAEPSLDNMRDALADFEPHIVHCMTHGRAEAMTLTDQGLSSEWTDFFMQFDFARTGVKLLFLNSCLSGHPGENSKGLALTSLMAGVTTTIGHLYRTTDEGARKFAQLVYSGLARGEALDIAFQAARSRVWSQELQENRPFLPLLFVRDRFLRFDLGSFEQ